MKARAYILNGIGTGRGALVGQLRGRAYATEAASVKPREHPNFRLADGRWMRLADGKYFNVKVI